MKFLILSLIMGQMLFFSCKGVKDSQSNQTQTLEELVEAKYNDKATIVYNKSRTHALVKSVTKKGNIPNQSSIHFFIYEKESSKVILEDFVNQGSIEWTSDTVVRVSKVPGVYKEGASNGYVFDIINQTQGSIE